jgi:hypothetical protein
VKSQDGRCPRCPRALRDRRNPRSETDRPYRAATAEWLAGWPADPETFPSYPDDPRYLDE